MYPGGGKYELVHVSNLQGGLRLSRYKVAVLRGPPKKSRPGKAKTGKGHPPESRCPSRQQPAPHLERITYDFTRCRTVTAVVVSSPREPKPILPPKMPDQMASYFSVPTEERPLAPLGEHMTMFSRTIPWGKRARPCAAHGRSENALSQSQGLTGLLNSVVLQFDT
jgi:hypothetical protein